MQIGTKNNKAITVNGKELEQVNSFNYLGSRVNAEGNIEEEVNIRIGKAASAFKNLNNIWKNNKISRKTKIRLYVSNVRSVLLYGSETWRTTKKVESRIRGFEGRCLRRIINIRWPSVISNSELSERTGVKNIVNEIMRRRWKYIGHIPKTKIRLYVSNVRSVLLYGSETWRTTKKVESRIRGFEGRCLRRIINIRWPSVISNSELSERTGVMKNIVNEITRRRWKYNGHIPTVNEEDKAAAIYETTNEILISNDPNDIKEKAVCVLNKKALEDGKAAILVNLKGNDVCKVAEICQRLAKFPKFFLCGPKAVTNKEYLHIALDYLNQYICAKGQTYTQAFAIGTIHFDMGKFRTALEWHKRAFLLSDYKRAIKFINALTFIASKLQDLEFINTLVPNSMWNEYLGKLLRFLDFLKTCPLTTKQVEIAEYLRNVLSKRTLISVRQFRKYQYTPSTRNIEYEWRTLSFPHPVIEPASDHLDFDYDYFAIMSHENSGWIECFLQQQLSTNMLYNDRTFTACPDVINYESCSTLLETTINGINKSQKVILVLSNDFLTKEWNVLKSIITETLQRRQVILLVILLENCDVPPEIDSEH
ncbi:unnamed protein product [Mytilus edulis]|uniref:TIR domain-containing protein n=1 Tax=Mytilus edulis TaxID=6550 RepID=A0A8S3S3M9_MYTED|nr:unnamed protein product [Mytilus edulis]